MLIRLELYRIKGIVVYRVFFVVFIVNNIDSIVNIIVIKVVLVENDTHIKKFITIISARKLLKIFNKFFRELNFIFIAIDGIMMIIVFTNKRAFLVTNNSTKEIIRRRRSFGRITSLFDMVNIINSITGILVGFFTDIKNNILHTIFNRIFIFGGSNRIG